jgi:UDP-glucose 4-epimerase
MRILVTGGLGYIGSHVVVTLLNDPTVERVFIIDNLINSHEEKLTAIRRLAPVEKLVLYKLDLQKLDEVTRIMGFTRPDLVIHLAGLKSVSQSTKWSLDYYNNNMLATMNLITAMSSNGIKNIIFSSSATVYSPSEEGIPFTEESSTGQNLSNPYARTKLFIEEYLKDIYMSEPKWWNISILRYFNPIGADHPSLQEQNKPLNDQTPASPNNLYPIVLQVANTQHDSEVAEGKRSHLEVAASQGEAASKSNSSAVLEIFGTDYPTPDGTAIRDYIHVQDLAEGHVAIAEAHKEAGLHIYNLGTGRGTSVKEFVKTFNEVRNTNLPVKYTQRRPGDVAFSVADVGKAKIF